MNLFEFEGHRPTVHPEAFVAPTAWVDTNPSYYAELAQRHRAGVAPVLD